VRAGRDEFTHTIKKAIYLQPGPFNLIMGNLNKTQIPYNPLNCEVKGAASRVGKDQKATWSSPSRGTTHHFGYYVLDTTTGQIVDQKSEIHSSAE
jgi:hypothetical protein